MRLNKSNYVEDANLLPGFIRDSLDREVYFLPLYSSLKAKDYDVLAEALSRIYTWNYCRADAPHSEEFCKALQKYCTEDGKYAFSVSLFTSSWLTARKNCVRIKSDMHKGKIKESKIKMVSLFSFSPERRANAVHIFNIEPVFSVKIDLVKKYTRNL